MISSKQVHCCGVLLFVLALHANGIHVKNPQNHSNKPVPAGELDGGGKPWPLFYSSPEAPQELPSEKRKETFVPADPEDPVGKRCCPGDTWGSWYYNVSEPTLVPFIIEKGTPGRVNAAVIIAPGGGYQFLAWHKEGTRIARWLNKIGFSAFVLKYRIPSNDEITTTKALIDAQRAISLVKYRAHEFGLNGTRIGFMGFSAGGDLAARLSCTTDRKYKPADEADSLTHIPDYTLIIYGAAMGCAAKTAPTTFMAIATDDQCVSSDMALDYFSGIKKKPALNHHELHIYGEGRHGYGDCSVYIEDNKFKDVCSWTVNAQLFLESVILQDVKDNLDGNPATYIHK